MNIFKLAIITIIVASSMLAAETNSSVTGAQYTAGVLMDEAKPDYSEESFWHLYKMVQKGDSGAYFYYARKLESKSHVSGRALKWYRKAAEAGNTQAQFIMMKRLYVKAGGSNNFATAERYARTVIASPDFDKRDTCTVALFLAGMAFRDGEIREGAGFLVRTVQSSEYIIEYLAILLLVVLACSYLVWQYHVSRKSTQQKYVWTLLDCLMALLLMVAGTLFWQLFLILIAIPVLHLPYLLSAMIFSLIAIIGAIFYCVLLAGWRGASLAEVFGLKWIAWYKYPVMIFSGICMILLLRALYMVVALVMNIPIQAQQIQQELAHETRWSSLTLIIIDGVIGAAIVEELLFRGVVHRTLRAWLPAWAIILVSATIFGAVHLDPWNFMPLALTGLVLAISYEMTKSLTVPIMLHAANNLLGFTIMILARYFS